MGDYADDARDSSFFETYGGHTWHDFDDGGQWRHGKRIPPPDVGDSCPTCSRGIVVARVNSKTGTKFLGCNKFPRCKFNY